MGEILFWVGLIGAALIVIITIVVIIAFGAGRKRLKSKLEHEYGLRSDNTHH